LAHVDRKLDQPGDERDQQPHVENRAALPVERRDRRQDQRDQHQVGGDEDRVDDDGPVDEQRRQQALPAGHEQRRRRGKRDRGGHADEDQGCGPLDETLGGFAPSPEDVQQDHDRKGRRRIR
jgi:hypothetical protein